MSLVANRPLSGSQLTRLLLSTALIAAAPVLTLPGSVLAQELYLDNLDQDPAGGINPGSGTWSPGSVIWSDVTGANHTALPQGGTGVLRQGDPAAPVVLDIDGTVRPGTLRVENDGFTLRGGQIGTGGDTVTFQLSQDVTLNVESGLAGSAIVAGNGMLYFTGTPSVLDALTVRDQASLRSAGQTSGALTVQDSASAVIEGTHQGDVLVGQDAALTASGTIDGDLTLDGQGVLSGSVGDVSVGATGNMEVAGALSIDRLLNQDGTLAVAAGASLDIGEGGLTNAGTMRLAGAVTLADPSTETVNEGTLEMDGGSLPGALRNLAGATLRFVSAGADLVVSQLGGDLTNEGVLEVTGSAPMELDLQGNDFINAGQVLGAGAGTGTLRIIANLIQLDQGSTTDLGLVELVGTITNAGTLLVSAARTLTDDLTNTDTGRVTVSASLDAAGRDIVNNGAFEVTGTGASATGIGTLTSTDSVTVGAGARLEAVQLSVDDGTLTVGGTVQGAVAVGQDGTAQLTGGTVVGDVTNDGLMAGAGDIQGVVDNAGVLRVTGAMGVAGLQNEGRLDLRAGGTLRSAADLVNEGQMDLAGTLAVADGAGRLTNADGHRIDLDSGRVEGRLVNEDGALIDLSGSSTVAGDVLNQGRIQLTGGQNATLSLEGDATFRNEGDVVATGSGRLRIVAQTIELVRNIDSALVQLEGRVVTFADLVFSTNTRLSGDLNIGAGSDVLVRADVNADGFDVTNDGLLRVGEDRAVLPDRRGRLTGVGVLDNRGEVVVIDNSRVQADSILNGAGASLTVAGEVEGVVQNAAGGSIALDDGTITGDLSNGGSLTGSGQITGQLTNAGTAALGGSVDALVNSGSFATAGDLDARIVSNTGALTLSNGDRLRVSQGLTNDDRLILSGGRVDGLTTNTGTITGRGTLGALSNSGTLSVETGDIATGAITGSGTVRVGAGRTLTATGGLRSSGQTDIDGTLTGSLNNLSPGTATLGAGSRVTGALTNAGELTGRGRIDGTLTNSGTADVAGSVGTVSNSGTLSVGAARQLTVSGDLNSGGTLNVLGRIDAGQVRSLSGGVMTTAAGSEIRADVSNATGATLTTGAGSRIMGDLANAGSALLSGRIDDVTNDGDLTVSGPLQVRALTNTAAGTVLAGAGTALTATGRVLNQGMMTLAGTVTLQGGAARLSNEGDMTLDGAQIIGPVESSGRLRVASDSRVAGNLSNTGTLTIATLGVSQLDLSGFTLTNAGTILRDGAGIARIVADLFVLQAGSVVDTGVVELVGRIDNAGQFVVSTATRLTADLTNRTGGAFTVRQTLDAAGRSIMTTGRLDLQANADQGLEGSIIGAGAVTSGGQTTIGAGTRLEAASTEVTAGTMTIAGRLDSPLTTRAGSTTELADGVIAGSLTNGGLLRGAGTITGPVSNSGELRATGAMTLTDVSNSGRLAVSGGGQMDLQSLTNSGTTAVDAGGVLRSATDIGNAGRIDLSGTLDVRGGTGRLTNLASGQLNLNGGRLQGDLVNDMGGTVDLRGSSALSGNLTNAGTIQMTAGGEATLTVEGGTFRNSGTVTSRNRGLLTIVADTILLESAISNRFVTLIGRVQNITRLDFDRDARLRADLNNAEGGEIGVFADVDADGFNVDNEGRITVGDADRDGSLTGMGSLTNTGQVDIAESGVVQGDSIQNLAGAEMQIAGTLRGPVLNQAGARIALADGRIDGDVTNAGRVEGVGIITGQLTNQGSAALGGRIGAIVNSGSLATQGTLSVGSLESDGQFTVGAGTTLESDASIINRGQAGVAGTVRGALTNGMAGRLDLTGGTITGAVGNAGTATMRGSVGGRLTSAGTLSTTGDLRVGGLGNSGQATVGANHRLTATTGVDNSGTLALGGGLAGSLRNAADGTTTLVAGSSISGSVTNDGALTGTSRITGPLDNRGTAVLAGSVGAVANSGSLQVGPDRVLDVAGAVTNGGTIALQGTLAAGGGVTNAADGRIALDGAAVLGDVTNLAGGRIDLISDSSITGDLINRGMIDMIGDSPDTRLAVQNGTFTNSGLVQVSGAGFLTIEADEILLESGSVVDNSRVALIGAVSNDGELTFGRDSTLEGDLRNGQGGTVQVLAALDAAGNDIVNAGSLAVGASGSVSDLDQLVNSGDVAIAAGARVDARQTVNAQGGSIVAGGTIGGDVVNQSGASLELTGGQITGAVENAGQLAAAGHIGGVLTNSGTLQTTGDLMLAGLDNSGQATVAAGHRLGVGGTTVNSGALRVDGVLVGSVSGTGDLAGSGQITGSLDTSGDVTWSGTIGGGVVSAGVARLSGSIGGGLRNTGRLTTTGDLGVSGRVENVGVTAQDATQAGEMTVSQGTTLTAGGGFLNGGGATLVNDGRIAGTVDNLGIYRQTGALQGSLVTRGQADVAGRVTGDLDFVAGRLSLAQDARIDGNLILRQDYTVGAGRVLDAGRTTVDEDATLSLGGRLTGALTNGGVVNVTANETVVAGVVTNAGRIDLTGDRQVGDVLQVGGLSGDGVVRLDLDLSNVTADQVVVRGGATDGTIRLEFNQATTGTVSQPGRRVTLIDVDDRFAGRNTFRYSADTSFASSERIVFSVEQMPGNGDLTLVSQTNPAIGALFGNVALTQSLIGSVVNRPTSPFVTGLAFEDAEKPCGAGAWGRATGGTATAEGATDNGISSVDSRITATYYGLQVGSDLACFDGRHAGWNTAFGVLGGVNHGSTTQPVFAIDGRNSQNLTPTLSSVTKADFNQVYGGVYGTATRGRLQADLQMRHERTDFTVSNASVATTGGGLGLDGADFTSTANTLSGSVSYAIPVKGDSGWTLVPTAGFAWSRLSTDPVRFDDGYVLSFEDSDRRIGFVGGTIARTYVQPQDNTALNAFATTTLYKDFADATVSVFSNSGDAEFEPQRLVSDNLGVYGEISIGANYIKILGEGSRARQFSTSARIDARYGESLDSIGVTGQVRWQF